VSAATGFGGMQAITEKGPVGVPTRTRTFAAWKEIFGTYEVATRGDAAYEAEHFFKEGGVELITSRQANYTNLDDNTSYSGVASNRTASTDAQVATAATKIGSAQNYVMTPGMALSLDVDNVGAAAATFDAAAGTVVDTTSYPVTDQVGLTFSVTLNGGTAQLVTFSGATTAAAGIINQINSQLSGGYAILDTSNVKIVSDQAGTGSSVAITAGTSGLTWAAATAGTGDVANIAAVTATEVETVIEADTTALVAVNGDGTFTMTSPTTGITSELDFASGTALTPLGLSVEVVLGAALGATQSTLKFEAGYRGVLSPGLAGNVLSTEITQNSKQAASGVGNSLVADITAGDTAISVVTTSGITVGSVIKVWDATNIEYKEVTAVRTVVTGSVVTFFVDVSVAFVNGFLDVATQLQTQEFDVQVYRSNILEETWSQMSMLDTADNYVETLMNDENFGSKYVVVSDQDAVAGMGADLPATDTAAVLLASGTSEIAGISDADWIGTSVGKTGLYAWDIINEMMPLCTLGNNSAGLVHAAAQYCLSRIWFEYLAYVDAGMSAASAVAYRNNVLGLDSSYVALYAGGEKVFDPTAAGSNPTRSITGLGAMMGLRARVDSAAGSGPWEAPAGEGVYGTIQYATDIVTEYSGDDHGLMNTAGINVLRKFTRTSPVMVWGTRTLDASTLQKFKYIPVRRFFQLVEKSLVDSTRWSVFRNNNPTLWGKLFNRIETYLESLLDDGAFPTTVKDDAFYIKIGIKDGTMDAADVDAGRVITEIGLAPNKPGEFIIHRIAQYTGGSSVTEIV